VASLGPFVGSLLANIVSEFGDKTFLVAAILSKEFSRLAVFLGASSAMVAMTLIACTFGHLVVMLMPSEVFMHLITAILFFAFGIRILKAVLLNESLSSSDSENEIENEVRKIGK